MSRFLPRAPFLPCLLPVGAALAVCLFAAPVAAQDSFVRLAEGPAARPVFSVLGTGMGLPFAELELEMRCPTPEAWPMAVVGVQAPPGTEVTLGFGDPSGGYVGIRLALLRLDPDRLLLSVDRGAFRAALSAARAAYPEAEGTDARVVVGGSVGLSIQRDDLVREMTAFAADCDPPARPAPPQRRAALRRR